MNIKLEDEIEEKVAYCKKCGSKMWTSHKHHWGPLCNNKLCDGSLMDAVYLKDVSYFRKKKIEQLLTHYEKGVDNNKML